MPCKPANQLLALCSCPVVCKAQHRLAAGTLNCRQQTTEWLPSFFPCLYCCNLRPQNMQPHSQPQHTRPGDTAAVRLAWCWFQPCPAALALGTHTPTHPHLMSWWHTHTALAEHLGIAGVLHENTSAKKHRQPFDKTRHSRGATSHLQLPQHTTLGRGLYGLTPLYTLSRCV